MNVTYRTLTRHILLGLLLSIWGTAFSATQSWKAECVGRFLVSVPGAMEVALPVDKAFSEWVSQPYQFVDGSPASKSILLSSGSILVSRTQDEGAFQQAVKSSRERHNKVKIELANSESAWEQERAKTYDFISFKNHNDFGWLGKAESQTFGIKIYLNRANRIISFGSTDYPDEQSARIAAIRFANNFHPRALFELPKGEGVCIPYGFIADDGKPGRQVGVTMRLIDHPDVEIFFEDRSAADYGIKQTVQTQERTELSMLWQEQAHSSKKIDLSFRGYHTIKLDGRNGTGSFVEITRKDGTLDYGYAAVVNGDHTAQTDSPQLMLYVIRTASRAKGKPISKNELKDMAYKIAASIKRREVK